MVFFGFPLVFFSCSLDLLFFYYARTWFFWFYWFYRGYPRVSFGSRLVLQWVWPSCTAPDYGGSSLAHSGEGGWSSPEMSQTLRSSKKLQNDSFLKLFVRVSGSGSACVSSPISSDARNEEDIYNSVESGEWRLESMQCWRGWREQPRNAPDAPELQKALK